MFRWRILFSVLFASIFVSAPNLCAQVESPCKAGFLADESFVWPALQTNFAVTKAVVEEQLLKADANTPASLKRALQKFILSVLDHFTKNPEELQPAIDSWSFYHLRSVQPYLPGLNPQRTTSMAEVADLAVRGDWELFLNVYGNMTSPLSMFEFFCDRSNKPKNQVLLRRATAELYVGTLMHAYARQAISRTSLPVPENFLRNQHGLIENLVASFEGMNEP